MTKIFVSVSTSAARYQDIFSESPKKLAGQMCQAENAA